MQSDLYSVGAVMLEAISGRRLEAGVDVAHVVPPALLPITTRALAPDPRHRFSSAEAMAEALGTLGSPPGSPRSAHAMPTRPPGTVTAPVLPVRVRRHSWWHFALLAAIAVVVTATAAYWLAVGTVQPTAPATSRGAAAPATSTRTHAKDAEPDAIRTLAARVAQGGMPGDPAMAAALDATAAEPAGTQRQASAEQTLSLAQVLVNGNGITADQYQDVVSTLEATGATVPTTTTTTTVPAPSRFEPFGGHGFHHGHGDGGGDGGQG